MPYADPERRRQYQNEWRNRRREKWFKINGPCVNCSSWDDLELDHIDPKKKINHRIWSWSAERREAELAKCQVLCHDCHVHKTIENEEHAFGEKLGSAKLNREIVSTIRTRLNTGEAKRVLAREYKVDPKVIRLIAQNKIWTH